MVEELMNASETIRNELFAALTEKKIVESNKAQDIICELDKILSNFDIDRKCTDIITNPDPIPPKLKEYIAVKIMEGRSRQTAELYKTYLVKFFEWARKSPEEIQTNDIRMFLYWYQNERPGKKKISNRSLETVRSVISYFFGWMQDCEYMIRNPAKPLKPIKYEKRHKAAMTRKDLVSIESVCKTAREKAIIETLYATGCRIGELVKIKKSDISWDTHEISVIGKGSKRRTTWINDRAELAIKEYLLSRQDDCDALFVSAIRPYRSLTTSGMRNIIENVGVRTDVSVKPTPHVYRHTTATLALKGGMSVVQVKEMLGHENISTTMQYLDIDQSSVKAAHEKYVV